VNTSSAFEASSEKIKAKTFSKTVKVGSIEELPLYKRYDVNVKVVSSSEEEIVSNGLKKQDLVVGDDSGSIRLTLWESEIGKMEVGCSYKLSDVMVREFRGQKFLSTSKKGTTIQKVEPLECVVEGNITLPSTPKFESAKNVKVMGVSSLMTYSSCLKCRGKVTFDDDVGECSKCGLVQCGESGKESSMGVLILSSAEGDFKKELRAYDQVLFCIAGLNKDESEKLTRLQALK